MPVKTVAGGCIMSNRYSNGSSRVIGTSVGRRRQSVERGSKLDEAASPCQNANCRSIISSVEAMICIRELFRQTRRGQSVVDDRRETKVFR